MHSERQSLRTRPSSRNGNPVRLKGKLDDRNIQGRLPARAGIEVAHKTGSLRGVKNDVGLVYSPKTHDAIAFLSRGQDDIPEITDRMPLTSRWLYDALSAATPE